MLNAERGDGGGDNISDNRLTFVLLRECLHQRLRGAD